MEGKIPSARPADVHDVSATYQIVYDKDEMSKSPKNCEELLDLLRSRHGVLMAGRDDKQPGGFKEVANMAGGYRFVEPNLLTGTLR